MPVHRHSATIRHLDWSLPLFNPPELRGKTIIQSNCNSREILYFNPANGHQLAVNQRDAKWDTWTCSMGFSVMGIWGEGEENMDINCVSRSNSQEYVVVSNDTPPLSSSTTHAWWTTLPTGSTAATPPTSPRRAGPATTATFSPAAAETAP